MAAPQGLVRVRQNEQTICFQVEGRATMAQSLPLRRFVEQGLAAGARAVRGDLRHCTFMDSTFVGTLLCLKRAVEKRKQGSLTLVCPSSQCCRLLEQMGVAEDLAVATEEPAVGGWTELRCETAEGGALKQNVEQAHQELAVVSGPAGDVFREVARCVAQTPRTEKSPESPPR